MPVNLKGLKRSAIALSLFAAMAFSASSWALPEGPPTFPDLPGWDHGEVILTTLETPSGNMGYWIERNYTRRSDGHSIDVVLLKGPGTAWQGLQEAVSADDGPMGSGSTYRSVRIGGHKGILEWHPLTGRVLVVELAPDITVTFETVYDDVDLEGFALELTEAVDTE